MNIKATVALAAGFALSACQTPPNFMRSENDIARDLVQKELALRGERANPAIKYPNDKGVINITNFIRWKPEEVCATYLVELNDRPRGANEDQFTCARNIQRPTVFFGPGVVRRPYRSI